MSEEAFRWVVAGGVIVAVLCLAIQAVAVIMMLKLARATQAKIMPLVDRATPILDSAHRILEETRPRIGEFSSECLLIAKQVREQVARISALIKETSDRAKIRVAQIDQTVDSTVEKVENMGLAVKGAVLRPVREVSGIVSAMRAAILTFAQGGRRSSVDHATQDEEMFI
jgi:hypothetical protein